MNARLVQDLCDARRTVSDQIDTRDTKKLRMETKQILTTCWMRASFGSLLVRDSPH